MERLPTGLFQPGNSHLHRVDPFIKLISVFLLLVAVLCTKTVWGYGLFVLFLSVVISWSKVRVEDVLQSVRKLKWFFLTIFLMNLCFYAPETAWISFGILSPSYEGAVQGAQVVARVLIFLVISNLLTITTSPMMLMKAMEQLLSPLRLLHVPTAQIAMILSVAVQFIPTLLEETEMIRKAQMARGARFDSNKLSEKATAVVPLVVPIFLAAFQRADELTLAMEARGYRTDRLQHRRSSVSFGRKERVTLLVCIGICVCQILFCF